MSFRTGIENLISKHSSWISQRNTALLSHPAAIARDGRHAIELLADSDCRLISAFGPEHGFFGKAGPGEKVSSANHKKLKIPIHSLYGATRVPSDEMLKNLECIVIDFMNIPARPYTYLATMLNVMRAAEQKDIQIIIADRPVPLPNTVDGPPLNPDFASFVAPAELPLAYGMTPGETALWISDCLKIRPFLKISKLSGYCREEYPSTSWPEWRKPSPAIVSWDSALCYLTTIFCEALPDISNYRGESLSFQAITAPWLNAARVTGLLNEYGLPGSSFHAVPENHTVIIEITSPGTVRPARICISLISAIQKVHGVKTLWSAKNARPEFMDKLMGGPETRFALESKIDPDSLSSTWNQSLARFRKQRLRSLLYKRTQS